MKGALRILYKPQCARESMTVECRWYRWEDEGKLEDAKKSLDRDRDAKAIQTALSPERG